VKPLTDEQRSEVDENVGLVHFVLRNHQGDDYADRVQDGIVGLMKAVQTYDGTLGFTFSTHAVPLIRQAIRRQREVEEGINYRRAQRSGTTFDKPISLDALRDGSDDDGGGLDVEDPRARWAFDDAIDRIAAAQDVARLGVRPDDLALYEDAPDATIARRLGISQAAVAARRYRLEVRLRAAAGVSEATSAERSA
jgi:RNA polymerase sigma factor (sigma-70 family)